MRFIILSLKSHLKWVNTKSDKSVMAFTTNKKIEFEIYFTGKKRTLRAFNSLLIKNSNKKTIS